MPHTAGVLKLILVTASAIALIQQSPTPRKPSYDVASIRPNAAGGNRVRVGSRNGRFVATNASLRMVLLYAYPVLNNEIAGEPNWADSARFDIDARPAPNSGNPSMETIRLMVQSLLEDRFKLKAHFETRDRPIYSLVVGRDRPKIRFSADQTPAPPGAAYDPETEDPPRGSAGFFAQEEGTVMAGTAVPLSVLVNMLFGQADRRIIDKTSLTGLYDFKLQFFPEARMSPFGGALPDALSTGPRPVGAFPSLFTAVQEQLGLRLESTTAPLQILVIDSVQRPSEN